MTCSTCRHFRPEDDVFGECRAKSPTALAYMSRDDAGNPLVQSSAVWPVVGPADGCGEWAGRQGAPAGMSPAGGQYMTSESVNLLAR